MVVHVLGMGHELREGGMCNLLRAVEIHRTHESSSRVPGLSPEQLQGINYSGPPTRKA